jgi:ADP-ribose pyrophosphatase
MTNDNDAHLRETWVSTELVQQGHFLQWRRDRVLLPDGKEALREYVVHPGAVMIIPLLPDGRLLMERQFRYAVGMTMIEFPAGKLDPNEAPMVCAQRELLEETGYTATRWARAGVMHPVIGYATEVIEIWFADGLTAGERHLDEGEFLDIYAASQDELEAQFLAGQLTDVKTIVGMMWLRQVREGSVTLDWMS